MLGNIAFLAGAFWRRSIMAKFISRRRPVSARALKRKSHGTVIRHHNGSWEDIKFTRIAGGWVREREDVTDRPTVVSSSAVAEECNKAFGYKDSWAEIY